MNQKKLLKNKRGLAAITGVIIAIVLAALVLVVGLKIMGTLKTGLATNSTEYEATEKLIDVVAGIPDWIGILVIVAIAGIAIAYLTGWFGGRSKAATA